MKAVELNSKEFYEVIAGEKPVLVDFWAPWCVYCRRIAPAYEKIAEQYGEELIVAKINIDDAPEIANREHIEVIPTLVLYSGGKAVDSIVAPESKARIESFLNEALAK